MSERMNIGDSVKTGVDHCPHCNHICDSASGAYGDHVPVPGDLSVCFYCGGMMKFSDDMALEALTDEEYLALPVEDRCKLSMAVQQIKKFDVNSRKKQDERTELQ